MKTDDLVQPDDVRDVAAVCAAALEPLQNRDWNTPAGELEWSAQQTLDHIIGALLSYSRHLATRSPIRIPPPRNPATGHMVTFLPAMAAVLAEVCRAAPADVLGFHVTGMADRSGFAAMGCDEMLVHTNDIVQGFGAAFSPPADLSRRVAARLFPWAPTDHDPWQTLLWANGRVALPDHDRLGPEWSWHCAPLREWTERVT